MGDTPSKHARSKLFSCKRNERARDRPKELRCSLESVINDFHNYFAGTTTNLSRSGGGGGVHDTHHVFLSTALELVRAQTSTTRLFLFFFRFQKSEMYKF